MATHPRGMRRAALALTLLLMMQSVAADPPPGQPDVTNEICSTWNSANGICDDYDSSLDFTSGPEWIASSVEVDVSDAEMVEMRVDSVSYTHLTLPTNREV